MEKIHLFTAILFVLTTCWTVWQFFKAAGRSATVLYWLLPWIVVQGLAGMAGFYQQTEALPPRFIFLSGPAILFILLLFVTRKGRLFLDSLDTGKLTLLHVARLPVEITLFLLFLSKLVPMSMTFEGSNYDILSGFSAPVIYYGVFVAKKTGRRTLLAWNILCLLLLANIVSIAVLSAPTPFQQLAFEQPNKAVTLFPYVWLPGVVVPLVLLSHLAVIRQLYRGHPLAD